MHQNCCHRTTTLVQFGFDHQTTGRHIDWRFQFQHFSLQQYLFQQGIDAFTSLGRNRDKRRIAAVLFRHNLFRNQFLLDAIQVGTRFVDLVDRHHQRHAAGFRVGNRFLGLWHDAIVSRHHQNHDVGCLGTTGTHCGKRFVARGIEESDHAARCFHVVSADMLRNATGFTGSNLGTTDVIQQRSFTMVNVTHDSHDRCPRHQLGVQMLFAFFQQCFRIIQLGSMCTMAHFFNHDHGSFLIQNLIDGNHLPQLHQMLDDFGCLDRHLVRNFSNSNGFRHMHVFDDGFGWRLEIAFMIIMMRVATPLRSRTPAVTTTSAGIAARLHAGTALLGRFILPGRRYVGRLDRFLVDGDNYLLVVFLFARLLVRRLVQGTFGSLRCRRRGRLRRLHDAARCAHHRFDLRHFVFHRLACALCCCSTIAGFLGYHCRLLFRFFCCHALVLFYRGVRRYRFNHNIRGFRRCLVCSFCCRLRSFCLGRLLGVLLSLLRFPLCCLDLFSLLGFQLRQTFLLFAQIGFLTSNQFRLTTCFFSTAFDFCLIQHDIRLGSHFICCRFIALDECTLLAYFNLNRARLASGIGLLDFRRFLAGQRNLFLFAFRRGTAHTAQVLKETILVFLRQRIGLGALFNSSRSQLGQQQIRRHFQLGGKLGYIVTRHSVLFSSGSADDDGVARLAGYLASAVLHALACNAFARSSYLASMSFISSSVTSSNSFSIN